MCAWVTQSACTKQCKYESKYKWLFRIYKGNKKCLITRTAKMFSSLYSPKKDNNDNDKISEDMR